MGTRSHNRRKNTRAKIAAQAEAIAAAQDAATAQVDIVVPAKP